jgi:dinuclear metal center YbgI/SA1388 family protein
MKIRDIITEIERFAPLAYQESYDNAGLTVGNANAEIASCLLCFDVSEQTVDEALEHGAGLIISHHPVIFGGLKRLAGRTPTERIVEKAIRSGIALYAAHTNLDSVTGGINTRLAEKLGLKNIRILAPRKDILYKLVVYAPLAYGSQVRNAIFDAGAGRIGNYGECSWNIEGTGTFRAGDEAKPFVGTQDARHEEPEIRIETIVQKHYLPATLSAMLAAHPYEEPAYDVLPLANRSASTGLGAFGELPEPLPVDEFFARLKQTLDLKVIRHNRPHVDAVSRVAVCGGAGESLVEDAIAAAADIFVSSDCKYHKFIDVEGKLILADAGHFETEYFAVEIFHDIIIKKFPNFAVRFAGSMFNPVKYFL